MQNIALLLVVLLSHFIAGMSQDEVFIHTDRDIYQAGETLQFKAYVISSSKGQQSRSDSLNIYLIDKNGVSHFEGKMEISDCAVIDQIVLPGSLEEGKYLLLAYCDGTKIDMVFAKSILIHETIIPSVLIDIEFDKKPYRVGEEVAFRVKMRSPNGEIIKRLGFQYSLNVNGTQVSEGKGKVDKTGQDEILVKYPDYNENGLVSFEVSLERTGNTFRNGVIIPSLSKPLLVNFFPEGGLLIDGYESKIGFTAFDIQGNIIDIQGDLVDQYGEVRGHINTMVPGLGCFSVLPDARIPLKLRITNPVWVQSTIDLPKTQSSGVVLRLISLENDGIHLEAINPIEDTYMPLRVEAFQGSEELLNERLLLTTKKSFVVPIADLSKGIVRINVKTGSGEILAQRCIYISAEEWQAQNIEGSISITDSYISPEWSPGPSMKQIAILGTELAMSHYADLFVNDQREVDAELIDAYMLTCIREPEGIIERDSTGTNHLRIIQKKYRLSQIDQYISELSNLQFFNQHYMSEKSSFSEFFIANKTELDKLGFIPKQLGQNERIRRQLDAGKSVLSIIMSIRAYRLVDNQMVFRGSDSFKYQGGAIIVIDGVPKGSDVAEIMDINPYEVASIKVSTSISEVMKYAGMENTAGVVIIETKKVSDGRVKKASGSQINFSPTMLWNPHYAPQADEGKEIIMPEPRLKSKYWKRIINPIL
ncbi:MAG: hypothetical protein U9N86_04835 [Bacteroidota bacterium]|nr:hypothetical protein [Bacteroidota bacterium]